MTPPDTALTINFPAPAPLLNLNDRLHWAVEARRTKQWREAAYWAALAALPRHHTWQFTPCNILVDLPVTTNRRRDPHNRDRTTHHPRPHPHRPHPHLAKGDDDVTTTPQRCDGSGQYTGTEPGVRAICADCGRSLFVTRAHRLPSHNTASKYKRDHTRETPADFSDDPALAAFAERFTAGAIQTKRRRMVLDELDHLPTGRRLAEGPLPVGAARGTSLFTKGRNGRIVKRS